MRLLTEISNDYRQQFSITTEENYTFDFLLEYKISQQSWFWSLAYNNFAVNGIRLVLNPNILRQYKAYLPFGIWCNTDDALKADPFLANDLITGGRIQLYTLTKAEVLEIEKQIYGQ